MQEPWGTLPALPDDAILVHIGTHKTGTTALQADLLELRDDLAPLGVTFPKTSISAHDAGQALTAANFGWEPQRAKKKRMRAWRRYAREVRAHPGRVVVSTEWWCQCNDTQAARLVRTLGEDRVHIIVGFRPLQSLLPSSWQQYIKSGKDLSYDDWLATELGASEEKSITPTFWRRNDVPTQVERWISLVGAERVYAVVVDSTTDDKVRRSMEQLLGLERGVIRETTSVDAANRSLSLAESELLLRVNAATNSEIPKRDYVEIVRFGAVGNLVSSRMPGPDEARLGLPAWSVPRVQEIATAHAEYLDSTDARVIGDPKALGVVTAREADEHPNQLPVESAELALVGAVLAASRLLAAVEEQAAEELAAATAPAIAAEVTRPPAGIRATAGRAARRLGLRRSAPKSRAARPSDAR